MLRVNGELINPELIEESFSRIKGEAEQRLQVPCCERDPEFQKQAEDEVADSILIAQEAEKRYPTIPEEELKPELKRMIDLYREHGASWEMLEKQRDLMRHEISATLRMEKLIDDVMDGDHSISEEEVQAFYEEFRADYTSPPESSCLHIMKPLSDTGAPPELYHKMVAIRNEALDGADFEKLAERETEKSTGEIDLGWIPLDRPTHPFETVLFSLKEGEISPVLIFEHAFHLIKVTGVKPEETQPLEEIREEIENRALARKKRNALQGLATEIRKEAIIERVEPEGNEED